MLFCKRVNCVSCLIVLWGIQLQFYKLMFAALTVDGDEMADIDGDFKSADQIANDLVTLSMLPESRWANLLKLDIIRYRNRLKAPPKIQVSSRWSSSIPLGRGVTCD